MVNCDDLASLTKFLVFSTFPGVGVNSYVAQEVLKRLNWEGVSFDRFISLQDSAAILSNPNVSEEQIVNIGYKRLVFDAFDIDTAETLPPGPKDPLSHLNMATNAKLVYCSDDRFGAVENLVSSFEPVFDPTAFGKQVGYCGFSACDFLVALGRWLFGWPNVVT